MKNILLLGLVILFISCNQKKDTVHADRFNGLATQYVKLGLAIGAYDSDFVDAYYGPDSLKPSAAPKAVFPVDSFLNAVDNLQREMERYKTGKTGDSTGIRANWMTSQLTAFRRRILNFSGKTTTFEEEARDLFGVTVPVHSEDYFRGIVARLDTLIPGKGTIAERFKKMSEKFIIPKDKLDTVFKTAIAISRQRTLDHYPLPAGEKFTLEFVKDKPWGGYNWYKGNLSSLIQVNTDLDIFIERAIDVASHESYPGHHVYNMLLEKNLYRDKGWVEVSLYPLFSPQSLIAEGSANYGIEMVFPGREKNKLAKEVLLPLAGLDTTGLDSYFEALSLKKGLSYVRNEVARGLLNKTMNEQEALRWLMEYGLTTEEMAKKSLDFIRKYRSYVINYNYGMDLVAEYIRKGAGENAGTPERWKLFGLLLSNEMTAHDLQGN